MTNCTEKDLERDLFGTTQFQEANPQTKLQMALISTQNILNELLYGSPDPTAERKLLEEKATHVTKRLAELTKAFIESCESSPPVPRGSWYLQTQN